MRNTTERPEAVEVGTVKLVGANANEIVENVDLLLKDCLVYDRMAQAYNSYGDGGCVKGLQKMVRIVNFR